MDNFIYDAVVIGAGPAGVSAAIYLKRAGISPLVVESGVSSLVKAAKIENYYGFSGSGKELYEFGLKQLDNLKIVRVTLEVTALSYENDFVLETASGSIHAKAVILASGASKPAPSIKGVKEFEGRGVSYCAVCDAFFYRKKSVGIIGGGAFALSEALALLPLAKSVTIFTDGEKPSADFPKNVNIVTDKIIEVAGTGSVEKIVTIGGEFSLSGVFIAVGQASASDLAKQLGVIMNGRFIETDSFGATNIPRLYAAGDCTGGLLQVTKAATDGAIAALALIKELKK